MANDNIPTIGFWVGAGPKQVTISVMDSGKVQNQAVFSDFPDTEMPLPSMKMKKNEEGNLVPDLNKKTGKFQWDFDENKNIISLREWLFGLLKDSDGNKFRQASVEIPVDFIDQKYSQKDGRPYKAVNFRKGDQAAVQLVSFVKQVTETLAVKSDSGAEVATEATSLMSKAFG